MRGSATCWSLTFPIYAPPGNQQKPVSKLEQLLTIIDSSVPSAEFTHETPVKTVARVSVVSALRRYDWALQDWIPARTPTIRAEKSLLYCIVNERIG